MNHTYIVTVSGYTTFTARFSQQPSQPPCLGPTCAYKLLTNNLSGLTFYQFYVTYNHLDHLGVWLRWQLNCPTRFSPSSPRPDHLTLESLLGGQAVGERGPHAVWRTELDLLLCLFEGKPL